MEAIDVFVRTVAITILLFVLAVLVLTLVGFWLDGVVPLRQALIFAVISIVSAGLPILLIYLTRAAAGAASDGAVRARYFSIFTILLAGVAILVVMLMASGSIVV
jgi:hypothetical protein